MGFGGEWKGEKKLYSHRKWRSYDKKKTEMKERWRKKSHQEKLKQKF